MEQAPRDWDASFVGRFVTVQEHKVRVSRLAAGGWRNGRSLRLVKNLLMSCAECRLQKGVKWTDLGSRAGDENKRFLRPSKLRFGLFVFFLALGAGHVLRISRRHMMTRLGCNFRPMRKWGYGHCKMHLISSLDRLLAGTFAGCCSYY